MIIFIPPNESPPPVINDRSPRRARRGNLIARPISSRAPIFEIPPRTLPENEAILNKTGTPIGVINQFNFTEIQITRTIDEHPSGNVVFYSYSLPSISIGDRLSLLGINFIIESISVNQYKTTVQIVYVVSLNLIGEHAPRNGNVPQSELDLPIRFPYGTTKIEWSDVQRNLSTRINIGTTPYKKYFNGQGELVITGRAELESAVALSSTPFIVYSKPTITGKSIDANPVGEITSEWMLDETTETSITNPPIYFDTELQIEPVDIVVNEITVRYEFENCLSYLDLNTPYSVTGVAIDSRVIEDLKNPGNTFDNGGRTKTARKIRERNGNPLTIEEEIYGYAFISFELFDLPTLVTEEFRAAGYKWPLNFRDLTIQTALSKWIKVQSSTTYYYYNEDGYLTRSYKYGWKLGRLQRESGSYETANLWLETLKKSALFNVIPDDFTGTVQWRSLARQFNSYCFFNPIDFSGTSPTFGTNFTNAIFRYPLLEISAYELDNLRNFYGDVQVADAQPEPKFVYRNSTYIRHSEIQPNPKDDPNDPASPYQPLIAHKEKRELTTTQIICPSAINAVKKTPELYSTTTYTQSIEGDYSSNNLVIGNSTQYAGRPSVHTQLTPAIAQPELPSGYSSAAQYRYFLTTNNTSTITRPRSSPSSIPVPTSNISFAGAVLPEHGLIGARNQLAKQTINAITKTIKVPFFDFYQRLEEGDIWLVDGQEWVILSISYTLTSIDNWEYQCTDGISVKLGLAESIPSTTVSRYPVN